MSRLNEIRAHRDEIVRIASRHKATGIFVFGSCARQEDDADSDIDFLVDFGEGASLFDQIEMQQELSELLGCDVDVVSRRGLALAISESVQREAVAV